MTCKVRPGGTPEAVSLDHSRCGDSNTIIKVNPKSIPTKSYNFTACVPPLHSTYNDITKIQDLLTIYTVMGVDHFVFYNHSIGDAVSSYLHDIILNNKHIEIKNWSYPSVIDVHYFGQLGFIQDCLYESMFSSRYVVFTDLDEVLTPTHPRMRTWHDILSTVDTHQPQGNMQLHLCASYMFRNTFFSLHVPNKCSLIHSSRHDRNISLPTVLCHTQREEKISDYGDRSKQIVIPERIFIMGIHNVWSYYSPDYADCNVPPELGLLYHYREWDRNVNLTLIQDTVILKYEADILGKHNTFLPNLPE